MKKFLSFICLFPLITGQAVAGSVTITSPVPSPSGIYDRLRLVPRTPLTGACENGTFYVPNNTNVIYFCKNNSYEPLTSPWIQTGTTVHLIDPINNKVGIGTSNPLFKMSLAQDGGILAEGIKNTGASLGDLPGNISRFIWYPKKAALRAGWISNPGASSWYDANVGDYSVAMGYDTRASGRDSFAMGYQNSATGQDASAVGGVGNSANGIMSFIAGGTNNSTDANAQYAFIGGGMSNRADGVSSNISGGSGNRTYVVHASIGGGRWNHNYGYYSAIGGGDSNTAYLQSSVIGGGVSNQIGDAATQNDPANKDAVIGGGRNNRVWGVISTVGGGMNNTAGVQGSPTTGQATVAGGFGNTAGGTASTVGGGAGNQALAQASTVAGGDSNQITGINATVSGGLRNIISGDGSAIPGGDGNNVAGGLSFAAGQNMVLGPSADRTFIWGHAANPIPAVTASDAFIIYSGNVGIRITNPQYPLHISTIMKIEPQDGPPAACSENGLIYVDGDGALCFCDGSGAWTKAAGTGDCI